MADNTTLSVGSGGDVISTDDIAGVKVQRVKVQYGADGSATDVSASSLLPVDAAGQRTTSGTITTSTSTITLTGLTGGTAYVYISGTYAGVTFTVENSPDGGTTWFTAPFFGTLTTNNATQIVTTVSPGTNATAAYAVPLNGANATRVRATAYTSGTANVVIAANGMPMVLRQPTLYDPANTQSVSVSNSTLNVVLTAGTATGTNSDTSAARTASGTGTAFSFVTSSIAGAQALWFAVYVTAVSGTAPTMTVRLQWSIDGGTTWTDWDTTNLQTPSITTAGTYSLKVGPGLPTTANASLNDALPGQMRAAWTIGGTTPSFTFGTRYWVQR